MICTVCLNAGVRIQYVKKQPQIFLDRTGYHDLVNLFYIIHNFTHTPYSRLSRVNNIEQKVFKVEYDSKLNKQINLFLLIFRIRDILVWIRISGSVPRTYGIRILLFSSVTFKMPIKNNFFPFFLLLLFKCTFTSFSKIKSYVPKQYKSRVF